MDTIKRTSSFTRHYNVKIKKTHRTFKPYPGRQPGCTNLHQTIRNGKGKNTCKVEDLISFTFIIDTHIHHPHLQGCRSCLAFTSYFFLCQFLSAFQEIQIHESFAFNFILAPVFAIKLCFNSLIKFLRHLDLSRFAC